MHFGDVVSDVWDKITSVSSVIWPMLSVMLWRWRFDAVKDGNERWSSWLLLPQMLRMFLKIGINIDFGGGFMKGITDSLDQLTGTLKAMETNLKAEALEKIAIAIGILTASVVALVD